MSQIKECEKMVEELTELLATETEKLKSLRSDFKHAAKDKKPSVKKKVSSCEDRVKDITGDLKEAKLLLKNAQKLDRENKGGKGDAKDLNYFEGLYGVTVLKSGKDFEIVKVGSNAPVFHCKYKNEETALLVLTHVDALVVKNDLNGVNSFPQIRKPQLFLR